MSHNRWLANFGHRRSGVRLHHNDTIKSALPLYHNNALSVSLGSVLAGGACVAIGRKFSASKFWDDVILNRATAFCYIGELSLLWWPSRQRDTPTVSIGAPAVGNGMRPDPLGRVPRRASASTGSVEFYRASELNIAPSTPSASTRPPGFCPLPYVIVDYNDDGSPWARCEGTSHQGGQGRYRSAGADQRPCPARRLHRCQGDREEASSATRSRTATPSNSGDLVHDQGFARLVRRPARRHLPLEGRERATTEVEGAVDAVDAVEQTVAYGVAIPGTDGSMAWSRVKLRDGQTLDPVKLAAHLYDSLPSYAIPLFVRIVDELESTSTFKTRKVELRNEGWQRDGRRSAVRTRRAGQGLRPVLRRVRR